jgi:hypothetical protein
MNSDTMKNEVDAVIKLVRFLKEIGVAHLKNRPNGALVMTTDC